MWPETLDCGKSKLFAIRVFSGQLYHGRRLSKLHSAKVPTLTMVAAPFFKDMMDSELFECVFSIAGSLTECCFAAPSCATTCGSIRGSIRHPPIAER